MNKAAVTVTIIFEGDIAEWLEEEAARHTRTPAQQAAHLLKGIKNTAERRKQLTVERKAKRQALGFR